MLRYWSFILVLRFVFSCNEGLCLKSFSWGGGGTLVLSVAKKEGKEEQKGAGEREEKREEDRKWKSVFPSGTHGNKWEQIGTCITPL